MPPLFCSERRRQQQRCWRERQVDPRLDEHGIGEGLLERRQPRWPDWQEYNSIRQRFVIRSDKGKGTGTGYVVLGTEVAGAGFNLLEPLLKTSPRVVGEGFGEVEAGEQTWLVGWLVGWMDDGLRLLKLDC